MLYKMTIEPQSNIGTPFRSDTLFGHACWTLLFCEGKERLEAFLANARNQQPELIFSDGFPAGYLPKPLLPATVNNFKDAEQQKQIKKINKLKWIEKKGIEAKNWDISGYFAEKLVEIEEKRIEEKKLFISSQPEKQDIFHNVINRFTASSLEENGLFVTEVEQYNDAWEKVDLYILTEWEEKRLQDFVKQLFSFGYGKDQTTGSGSVKISALPTPITFPSYEDSNYFLVLSRMVADSSVSLEKSYYDLETKYGKIWSALNPQNPFKKPILQMIPGSILFLEKPKAFAGVVLEKIADDDRVIENNCSILYPLPKESVDV